MTAQEAILKLKYQEKMRGKGIDYEVNNLTISIAITALEKQIPKKIVKYNKCPVCNRSQSATWYCAGSSYCEFCGQALDWSDDNDL